MRQIEKNWPAIAQLVDGRIIHTVHPGPRFERPEIVLQHILESEGVHT
jgi:hypothetical protein